MSEEVLDLQDLDLMDQFLEETEVEAGEIREVQHPSPEPVVQPPEVQLPTIEEKRANRVVNLVHDITRGKINQALAVAQNLQCSICQKVTSNKKTQYYHIAGHYASALCQCGFSHFDLREVRKHQKLVLSCEWETMYIVCPLSIERYLSATGSNHPPHLRLNLNRVAGARQLTTRRSVPTCTITRSTDGSLTPAAPPTVSTIPPTVPAANTDVPKNTLPVRRELRLIARGLEDFSDRLAAILKTL